MTKSVISHAKNTFDIKATPFLDSWKSTVLVQAKLLGIPLEPARNPDFKLLSDMIEARLLQSGGSINNLKHTAYTNNDSATVLTAQEQVYLQKAKLYNIKLDGDQWCYLINLHIYDAIDSWEEKLKEALFLGVDWQIGDYDPEGLERAIEEKKQADNIEAREELRQANAYYYSTRGV